MKKTVLNNNYYSYLQHGLDLEACAMHDNLSNVSTKASGDKISGAFYFWVQLEPTSLNGGQRSTKKWELCLTPLTSPRPDRFPKGACKAHI